MIEICACESQPIVLEGLRNCLGATDDMNFMGGVTSPQEVFDLIAESSPKL